MVHYVAVHMQQPVRLKPADAIRPPKPSAKKAKNLKVMKLPGSPPKPQNIPKGKA